MRVPRSFRLGTLVALATAVAACSDSTGPSTEESPDLSAVLAELQPSSLAPLAAELSGVPAAALGAPVPSGCAYDGASRSFTCPLVTVSNLRISQSYTLLDASGAPQSAFNKATTAAVRMKSTAAGTLTSGASTITIDDQRDVTLSGLLTGVHTLNGTSLTHTTGTIGTGTTALPIAMTAATTITNLVLPKSPGVNSWPQSGSIATTITDAGFGAERTSTFTIAFNGTSTATITVTGGGMDYTFTVDLAHPVPVRG